MQTSSPIHRGVFMSRGILGRGLKPPPLAVAPDRTRSGTEFDDAGTCDDPDQSRRVHELPRPD